MAQPVVRNRPTKVVVFSKQQAVEPLEVPQHARLGEGRGSFKAILTAMPDVGTDEDFARPRVRRRVRFAVASKL